MKLVEAAVLNGDWGQQVLLIKGGTVVVRDKAGRELDAFKDLGGRVEIRNPQVDQRGTVFFSEEDAISLAEQIIKFFK